ncbi:hypothetical protein [Arthrobacter psychrochitiniphilus]|uniref:hypothetical protein n=1 Tax=Arthrobacter psychrochitiniphilus TaxID=291045 RepID=UPI001B881C8F|nr:hypothetical protein [Arthrobacter psychrochitiniphilus]
MPAPVVKPAPGTTVAEPEITEGPVEEIAEEIPVEVETTTAAPPTAAPTTIPATIRPAFGSPSPSPSNSAQALPIVSTSSTMSAPSNPLLLQLLVIGLLLAVGLWYLRFMKRGSKHLGASSKGKVK